MDVELAHRLYRGGAKLKREVGDTIQTFKKRQRYETFVAGDRAPTMYVPYAGVRGVRARRQRHPRSRKFLPRYPGKKFADFELGSTVLSETWTGSELDPGASVLCLSAVAQGTGAEVRTGRTILIHSLYIRAKFTIGGTESQAAPLPSDSFVRLIVFLDTQTNGVQAQGEEVMEIVGGDNILAFRNLENTDRFRILKDKSLRLDRGFQNEGAVNLFATNSASFQCNFFIKFKKPLKVRFTIGTTTGVIANVTDNSLHLIGVRSDNGFSVDILYKARIRFTEI